MSFGNSQGSGDQLTSAVHIPHVVDAYVPPATTTQNYTTAACSATVTGHNLSVNVCTDLVSTSEVTASSLITPTFNVFGCNGAAFLGFQILSLPSLGTLTLNGVAVTLNQVLSKNDFAKLIYTLGANTATATDTSTYRVNTTAGNSGTLTISYVIAHCYDYLNDDCDECDVTTTTAITTTHA